MKYISLIILILFLLLCVYFFIPLNEPPVSHYPQISEKDIPDIHNIESEVTNISSEYIFTNTLVLKDDTYQNEPNDINDNDKPEHNPDRDVIPGEFILSFYDDRDKELFIKKAESRGIKILDSIAFKHSVHIYVDSEAKLNKVLEDAPAFVDRSPNYYVQPPDNPELKKQKPDAEYIGFGAQSLKWLGVNSDNNSWGKGVIVAVLDTGVSQHSSLDEKKIIRLDFVKGNKSDGLGYGSHGTAVASIIAGTGADVKGIAPASKIMSIKVLSDGGQGDTFTLAKGILEAVDHGAKVINISLGSHGDSFILKEVVDFAIENGVIIVAAAGNESVEGVLWPARYNGVLAVSAVDAGGRHMFFANRGAEVDIAAPGLGVNAAWSDKKTVGFSGTSAAVPFVSGAAAWLLSENPEISTSELIETLLKYSDDRGAPGKDGEYGQGILDVQRIIQRNKNGVYDIAVGVPFIQTQKQKDNYLTILVYIQNRGTEIVGSVDLTVEIDGNMEQVFKFYNVAVGQTVNNEIIMDYKKLKDSGSFSILLTAEINGVEDANPGNNVLITTIATKRK